MAGRVLQNHNCVAALQHRLSHNVAMSLTASERSDVPSTRSAANPLRPRARLCRAGLGVAALLGVCVLAAGCGSGSSPPSVASLGPSTTTTIEPSAVPSGSKASGGSIALAFVGCMRTHGEPNMPEPSITRNGRTANINLNASAGVDPNSPQFVAAIKACQHLLPSKGAPSAGQTITPADQADYLKGAACMRSHGFPDFPDPTFRNNNVTFSSTTPIDANSSQYKSALATCQKLIPAGLPYSSPAG
jgi:hypothetical protein